MEQEVFFFEKEYILDKFKIISWSQVIILMYIPLDTLSWNIGRVNELHNLSTTCTFIRIVD